MRKLFRHRSSPAPKDERGRKKMGQRSVEGNEGRACMREKRSDAMGRVGKGREGKRREGKRREAKQSEEERRGEKRGEEKKREEKGREKEARTENDRQRKSNIVVAVLSGDSIVARYS